MNLIELHKRSIKDLCTLHKVKKLYAFGSILSDGFTNDSDIDLLVIFEPLELNKYADNYYRFKFSLENIFKRPVDLLEEKAIHNPYFKNKVESNRLLIYGS